MVTKWKELGIKIRNARKIKNLTQEELASKIGLKKSVISRYERGNRVPRTVKLKALAEALDLKIEELLEALVEDDVILKWANVNGGPREIAYIPVYQNKIDNDEVNYSLTSLGVAAAAGAKLSEGQYIWVVNVEGVEWVRKGTRLLVRRTDEINKGDLAIFHLCDEWIWVGEVTECKSRLYLKFVFNRIEELLELEKSILVGKVVHTALDL